MDVPIRPATEDDLPGITEIYNQAVAMQGATAHTSPVSLDERRDWLRDHIPDRYPVFVAPRASGIAGYCSLSAYRPGRMALRHTAEISYYVHEDYQGQGVGTALIEHALAEAPRLGFRSLFAILLDKNPRSIGLLQKFGFEQWGHMPDVADFAGARCGHLYFGRHF